MRFELIFWLAKEKTFLRTGFVFEFPEFQRFERREMVKNCRWVIIGGFNRRLNRCFGAVRPTSVPPPLSPSRRSIYGGTGAIYGRYGNKEYSNPLFSISNNPK
jgi:hypothetical protein